MTITGWPITLEQFLALPEAKPALEYGPDGEVSQKMSPSTDRSILVRELGKTLDDFGFAHGLGRIYPELRINIGGLSRVPDVTFYAESRPPARPYSFTAPDLVIEITSPGQSREELGEKCSWYVEQGVSLALLVDPETRTIQAFQAGQQLTLRGRQALPLQAVLPGLELSVDEVFSALA